MTRLMVTCPRCGVVIFMRDNGYERPRPARCPFCGSGDVRRAVSARVQAEHPREAA